jgi:hypothetical protein
MNRLNKRTRLIPVAVLCVVAVGGAALGLARSSRNAAPSGQPVVKVMLSGSVERGGERLAVERVDSVKPGEVLDWKITSLNEGTGAARDYKAVGQIPQGTTLVAGSAAGENGSTVTYSIDGGKSFSTLPVIDERQADGSVKKVPAPVSMYTQVRYEWSDELAAGGKLNASYRVRVK